MNILIITLYILIGLFVLYGIYELFYKLWGFGVVFQTILYILITSFFFYVNKGYFKDLDKINGVIVTVLWFIGFGVFTKLCERIEDFLKRKKEQNNANI